MPAPAAGPRYRARVVEADEWLAIVARLPGVTGLPSPEYGVLVVVEDTHTPAPHTVIGSWCAMNVVHMEGLFLEPAHRHHPKILTDLLHTMIDALGRRAIPEVLALIDTPQVMVIAETVGFEHVPGSLYKLRLGQGET